MNRFLLFGLATCSLALVIAGPAAADTCEISVSTTCYLNPNPDLDRVSACAMQDGNRAVAWTVCTVFG